MRSDPTSAATMTISNSIPALPGRFLGSRFPVQLSKFGVYFSLRSPYDPTRAQSRVARHLFGQLNKHASRGRAAPRSQFIAVAATGSASSFLKHRNNSRSVHLSSALRRCVSGLLRCKLQSARAGLWPNPSVNRTRYGWRCKAGVRRLRHLRTPALHRPPSRAGYLKR